MACEKKTKTEETGRCDVWITMLVGFIPSKFLRRPAERLSSLSVPWLCSLDCASEHNSVQRGDHAGPGFIRLTQWTRPQAVFTRHLQKWKLRLRRWNAL